MSPSEPDVGSTPSPASLSVFVVEDDRVLRQSLTSWIGRSPGFTCGGAAGSVEEALRARTAPPPDVVLLDIHLPGVQGSIGVAQLLEKWPTTVVLMHTVYEEDRTVFESLCHGASGYILKRTPPERLLEAIAEARAGGAPMSPEIARKVLGVFRRIAPPPDAATTRLSPQESRLLAQIAAGASYREAADELDVSINTVRTHIRSIYEKLHVHTRSEAVSKALRAGLI